MFIREKKCKSVIVEFSETEISDITNGLYEATQINSKFRDINCKISFLNDVSHHGWIDDLTIVKLFAALPQETQNLIKKLDKKEGDLQ